MQKVGLQHAYAHDDGTYKYLSKVMALPFLPEGDVVPMFKRLSPSHHSPITNYGRLYFENVDPQLHMATFQLEYFQSVCAYQ